MLFKNNISSALETGNPARRCRFLFSIRIPNKFSIFLLRCFKCVKLEDSASYVFTRVLTISAVDKKGQRFNVFFYGTYETAVCKKVRLFHFLYSTVRILLMARVFKLRTFTTPLSVKLIFKHKICPQHSKARLLDFVTDNCIIIPRNVGRRK